LDDQFWIPAESKAAVMQVVAQAKRRSGWPAHRTLAALGYTTPFTWRSGRPEQVRERRAGQIAAASAHRTIIHQQRLALAA
jgi:hypothetical protein